MRKNKKMAITVAAVLGITSLSTMVFASDAEKKISESHMVIRLLQQIRLQAERLC